MFASLLFPGVEAAMPLPRLLATSARVEGAARSHGMRCPAKTMPVTGVNVLNRNIVLFDFGVQFDLSRFLLQSKLIRHVRVLTDGVTPNVLYS